MFVSIPDTLVDASLEIENRENYLTKIILVCQILCLLKTVLILIDLKSSNYLICLDLRIT